MMTLRVGSPGPLPLARMALRPTCVVTYTHLTHPTNRRHPMLKLLTAAMTALLLLFTPAAHAAPAQTQAQSYYTSTCRPMAGYSYTNNVYAYWTTHNGVKYLTALEMTTTYPKGAYAEVSWGGKTGRVNTEVNGGWAYFKGWVATNGTRWNVKSSLSLPLAPDPHCTTYHRV